MPSRFTPMVCATLFAAGGCHAPDRAPATAVAAAPTVASQLFRMADTKTTTLPVATLHFALENAATRSLRDLLVGSVVLQPGQQLHPPHQHAEEEFLYLVSGSGRWSLEGREFPAQTGDLLYLEPWAMHGITNTGSEPLTFFVLKWNGNGQEVPTH